MTDTTWTPQISCKRALFFTHLRVYLEVVLIWQLFSKFEFKASISFRFVALQFSMYGSQTGLGIIAITANQKQKRLDSYKEGFYVQTPQMAAPFHWPELTHLATFNHKEYSPTVSKRKGTAFCEQLASFYVPQGGHKFFNSSSFTSKIIASSRINFSPSSCDKCYDFIFYFIAPLLHSF